MPGTPFRNTKASYRLETDGGEDATLCRQGGEKQDLPASLHSLVALLKWCAFCMMV